MTGNPWEDNKARAEERRIKRQARRFTGIWIAGKRGPRSLKKVAKAERLDRLKHPWPFLEFCTLTTEGTPREN